MNTTVLFWTATIVFCLIMICMGYYIYRQVRKDTGAHQILDFRIASRRYSGWWLAASIAGLLTGSFIGKPSTKEQLEGTEIFDVAK